MALCQVLMMASESCWIRYSEPSWLRSWRDTSHDRVLSPRDPSYFSSTSKAKDWGTQLLEKKLLNL